MSYSGTAPDRARSLRFTTVRICWLPAEPRRSSFSPVFNTAIRVYLHASIDNAFPMLQSFAGKREHAGHGQVSMLYYSVNCRSTALYITTVVLAHRLLVQTTWARA
jgi:hypothetical protein